MGPRTRASALPGRVYSSPTIHQQLEFKPRKRIVKARHSIDVTPPARQETLTQMDFVSLQSSAFDDEEQDALRKKKRRRTDGDAETPSSTYHTQTLTQIDFVSSTPAVKFENEDEEDISDALIVKARMSKASENQVMGPPKTPVRRRLYEVPSSQSPVTPLSNHSQRYLEMRSPLTSIDTNSRRRIFSPTYKGVVYKQPVLEVRDSFDVSDKGSQAKETATLRNLSVTTDTAEQELKAKSSIHIKQEIQDSDEEYDDFDYNEVKGSQQAPIDELESEGKLKQEMCNDEYLSDMGEDEPIPETQPEGIHDDAIPETQLQGFQDAEFAKEIDIDIKASHFQSDLTDTQEAEQQLNSTILQFTQRHELNHVYTSLSIATQESEPGFKSEEKEENQEREHSHSGDYIRPSQATTVAESSPPPLNPPQTHYSTPIIRPNSADDETQEDFIEDIQDDEDDALVTMIPDSPAHARPHKHHHYFPSPSTTQSLPPLPFSLASSQLLTRSQMLPESLMNDSVPPPPPLPTEFFLIEDSDLED